MKKNKSKRFAAVAVVLTVISVTAAVAGLSATKTVAADETIKEADAFIAAHSRKAPEITTVSTTTAAEVATTVVTEPETKTEENYIIVEENDDFLDFATEYCENATLSDWDGTLNVYVGAVWYTDPITGIEHKETYYSELVLPGEGLDIPGRWTDESGLVRDGDGYIVAATDWDFIPYGSIVETTLGTAKVYDTGCSYGTVDIYVNW